MMRRNESIILAALVCFGIGCIVSMLGGSSLVLRDEVMPADLYSNVLAALLVVACIYRLITLYCGQVDAEGARRVVVFTQSTLLIAACSIVYTLGITNLGFYISTFVCMFVLFLGFENWDKARLKSGLAFSAGLCAIFYVTFSYMKIYLPDAIFF